MLLLHRGSVALGLVVVALMIVHAPASNIDLDPRDAGAVRQRAARAVGGPVESPSYWVASAQADLALTLKKKEIIKRAKNVIMFLGDGMGVTTTSTGRIVKGQAIQNVEFGEEGTLHIDTFPHIGMSRTFCTDAQTADSACSSTAYLCGVKANSGTMGVNSNVEYGDCGAQSNQLNHVSSILAWAQAAGKSTGIVTTTRVTHASPGGTYAHTADRDWECDTDARRSGADPEICLDIAKQLILNDPGRNINVILGGGWKKFLPNSTAYPGGQRGDGRNLIQEWLDGKVGQKARYVQTASDLKSVDPGKTDYLLGLFTPDHMDYYYQQGVNNEPTLTDMTEAAIKILSRNKKGFFLFVEGGKIDLAHHQNQALLSMWEVIEFDRAIEKGDHLTSDEDTLIVVTADHSHSYTFNGYAPRGSNITAFGGMGDDNMPYSVTGYANGPGYLPFLNDQRHNISNDNVTDLLYQQVVMVPLDIETHGGEDVAIYAKGPFSHLFVGVHLQSYIPHAMAYASCLGNGLTFCKDAPTTWPWAIGHGIPISLIN